MSYNNIKLRLLGYYTHPWGMNAESERIEDANELAPLLEKSLQSLCQNNDVDDDIKKIIQDETVFVFKDENDNLCAYYTKDKSARVTRVRFNHKDIVQVPLKYKAWFYPGQCINLIQQNSESPARSSAESKRNETTSNKRERRTSKTSRAARYVEDGDVAKVKTRLRLENNFFIVV